MHAEFCLEKMKAQYEECSGRTMLGDDTGGWKFILPPVRFQCFRFQLDSHGHTCAFDHMYKQFRHGQRTTLGGTFSE